MDFIGNITQEICLRQSVVLAMVFLIIFPFELLLYKNRVSEPVHLWKDVAYSPVRWGAYIFKLFKVETSHDPS